SVHNSAWERSLFVGEKFLMCRACSTPVQTEIVAARGIETLMPEELFDMADRAAVKEEGRGHGVPQDTCTHRVFQVRLPAIDRERILDPILLPEAVWSIALRHK